MPQGNSNPPNPTSLPPTAAKKSQTTEQARNRENQRRLRERRKDYTQELERKLRTLEREGVHATEVVQKAARVVVEENRLLRLLLGERGVSARTVEEYVRKARASERKSVRLEEIEDGIGVVHKVLLEQSPTNAFRAQDTLSREGLSTQPPILPSDTYAEPLAEYTAPTEKPGTSSSDLREDKIIRPISTVAPLITMGCCSSSIDRAVTNAIAEKTGCGMPQSNARKGTGLDEMDCEEAALIITSLRGGEDPQDVWPELGCSHVRRTRIKNTVLMRLAG